MTPSNIPNKYASELDMILEKFWEECPNPTETQIAEWQTRYPKYEAEISDFGLGLLLLSREPEHHLPKPTAEELGTDFRKWQKRLHEMQRRDDQES